MTRIRILGALCLAALSAWGRSAEATPANCTSLTWNTWQKDPAMSTSGWPGAYEPSLSLGGDVVTTAGVIAAEWLIGPSTATSIGGDSFYGIGTGSWMARQKCVSEIYLQYAFDSGAYIFPWTLVSSTATGCPSEGVWYSASPSSPPTYTQLTTDTHTPTSFSIDSSSHVYTTGGNGSCTTGSAIPHGSCIREWSGSSWNNLTGNPGADQVTSGNNDAVLVALGSSRNIFYVNYPGTAAWTNIPVTSKICVTSATLSADLIASNGLFVYAINDSTGFVYSWEISVSTCWAAMDNSVSMLSISANPGLSGESALLGTDSSGNLWYYCNANTP